MDKSENYICQQAVMILFNDRLRIEGIHQLDVSSIMSSVLKQNVRVRTYQDSVKLYFTSGDQLVEKVIFPPWGSNPVTSIRMVQPNEQDPENDEYQNQILHFQPWYKDVFLAWGIKSEQKQENQAVFYLQKMDYP
jgi:hypothetical protein